MPHTKANVGQGATETVLVTAVAGKAIRVIALLMMAGGTATEATFLSKPTGSAGVAISCLFANGINGGAVLPPCSAGWFQTVAGEALTVTTGSGSATGIQLVYDLV